MIQDKIMILKSISDFLYQIVRQKNLSKKYEIIGNKLLMMKFQPLTPTQEFWLNMKGKSQSRKLTTVISDINCSFNQKNATSLKLAKKKFL